MLGTEGYIELRKYIDMAGCEGLDYFRQFFGDVENRSETAMTQNHVYEVCRLSLETQAKAARISQGG